MIKAGKLDKYGKPNENTPKDWMTNYVDYSSGVKSEVTDIKQEFSAVKEEPETPSRKVSLGGVFLLR